MENKFPPHTPAILLNKFSLLDFSNVAEFTFSASYSIPELTAFVACLPSIHIIDTDMWSLRHLISVQDTLETADATVPKIAFPTLKVLKVHSLPASFFSSSSNPVSEFILGRITHGHAISTLDLTQETRDILPEIASLKEADGLKVLWRRKEVTDTLEYVCGTST